jgi:hypothetical protein
MNQLISVLADGKLRYYLTTGDELTEFAIVNIGDVRRANGHAAVAIATVGAAMVDGFGLDHHRPALAGPRELPPPPPPGGGLLYQRVAGWVTDHPGQRPTAIAAAVGTTTSGCTSALRRARDKGLITNANSRWYPAGTKPNRTRHARPPGSVDADVDRLVAGVTAQPGATTAQLRAVTGLNQHQWGRAVATARARGMPIRREGWSTGARWYPE